MNKAQEMLKFLEMRGQGSGPEGTGGTSICVCPKCKHEESHERSVPCNEKKCPKCGTLMTGKGTVGSKVEDESKAKTLLNQVKNVNEDYIKDVKKVIDDSTKIYILLDTIGGIVKDEKIVGIVLKAARDAEKIEGKFGKP